MVILNADELHQHLQTEKRIEFSLYNLFVSQQDFKTYLSTQGKSWKEKAANEGQIISLEYSENGLVISQTPGPYDAAIAADFLRYRLLEKEDTFTFETVLSDERKIQFLKEAVEAGFKLYLYFICTKDPEINKTRLANRVAKGGHNVPPDKVENRYYSSLNVLPLLIPLTYRCFLFDNSEEGRENEINLVAEIENGMKLTIKSADVPWWVEEHVIRKIFQ